MLSFRVLSFIVLSFLLSFLVLKFLVLKFFMLKFLVLSFLVIHICNHESDIKTFWSCKFSYKTECKCRFQTVGSTVLKTRPRYKTRDLKIASYLRQKQFKQFSNQSFFHQVAMQFFSENKSLSEVKFQKNKLKESNLDRRGEKNQVTSVTKVHLLETSTQQQKRKTTETSTTNKNVSKRIILIVEAQTIQQKEKPYPIRLREPVISEWKRFIANGYSERETDKVKGCFVSSGHHRRNEQINQISRSRKAVEQTHQDKKQNQKPFLRQFIGYQTKAPHTKAPQSKAPQLNASQALIDLISFHEMSIT